MCIKRFIGILQTIAICSFIAAVAFVLSSKDGKSASKKENKVADIQPITTHPAPKNVIESRSADVKPAGRVRSPL